MPGQLQKMFGGSASNAYMLIYRQRKQSKVANEMQSIPIPDYWVSEIEKINQLEREMRGSYDTLKNQFDIVI